MEQSTNILSIFLYTIVISTSLYFFIKGVSGISSENSTDKLMLSNAKYITKKYKGNESNALNWFNKDSIQMGNKGYYPKSQNYIPGRYGCGSFILALLLCFVLIGFIVFIYMIIVKPEGSLVVLYELKESEVVNEKTCPMCAETIKFEAKICRFCNFDLVKT